MSQIPQIRWNESLNLIGSALCNHQSDWMSQNWLQHLSSPGTSRHVEDIEHDVMDSIAARIDAILAHIWLLMAQSLGPLANDWSHLDY